MISFSVTTKVNVYQSVWQVITGSRTGPVGQNMRNRSHLVAAAARRQVGVDTGMLRASIHTNHETRLFGQTWRVEADDPKAYMHHEGTRPHWIKPQTAHALKFRGNGGRMVYAARVLHPGTRPNRFLSDNLHWAAG